MDHETGRLGAERLQLADEFNALNTRARIRPASAFHPLDESVFYAEDGVRELRVCIIEDVTWGPDISHYVEEPDEFRQLRRMTIDIPNELEGSVPMIRHLFIEWFGAAE